MSVNPPIFLGVVAMDVYMDVLYDIIGNKTKVTELLEEKISEAKCLDFKMFNETDKDIIRSRLGGEEAIWGIVNFNFTQFDDTETCDEGSLPEQPFGEITDGKSIQQFILLLNNGFKSLFSRMMLSLCSSGKTA